VCWKGWGWWNKDFTVNLKIERRSKGMGENSIHEKIEKIRGSVEGYELKVKPTVEVLSSPNQGIKWEITSPWKLNSK